MNPPVAREVSRVAQINMLFVRARRSKLHTLANLLEEEEFIFDMSDLNTITIDQAVVILCLMDGDTVLKVSEFETPRQRHSDLASLTIYQEPLPRYGIDLHQLHNLTAENAIPLINELKERVNQLITDNELPESTPIEQITKRAIRRLLDVFELMLDWCYLEPAATWKVLG